jgi:hypothetical protein
MAGRAERAGWSHETGRAQMQVCRLASVRVKYRRGRRCLAGPLRPVWPYAADGMQETRGNRPGSGAARHPPAFPVLRRAVRLHGPPGRSARFTRHFSFRASSASQGARFPSRALQCPRRGYGKTPLAPPTAPSAYVPSRLSRDHGRTRQITGGGDLPKRSESGSRCPLTAPKRFLAGFPACPGKQAMAPSARETGGARPVRAPDSRLTGNPTRDAACPGFPLAPRSGPRRLIGSNPAGSHREPSTRWLPSGTTSRPLPFAGSIVAGGYRRTRQPSGFPATARGGVRERKRGMLGRCLSRFGAETDDHRLCPR